MKITITENDIKHVVKKVVETITKNNSTFQIKEFTKEMPECESYIKPNRNLLWEFLNNGYKMAGYSDGFLGCDNEKSLYKNSVLIKIAYVGDVWVAISVYTGYQDGRKCVGITSTIDEKYREQGKLAVKKIIKTDIGLYKEFYWTECSGTIEHLYEKYKGIKIPVIFASEIVGPGIEYIEGDEWHYKRLIGSDMQTKIIYGFNNTELFDEVKKKYSDYIQNCIQEIENKRIDEDRERPSFGKYSAADCAERIINIFVRLRFESRIYELPQDLLSILHENIKNLEFYMKTVNNIKFMERRKLAIKNGKEILHTTSPMIINKF